MFLSPRALGAGAEDTERGHANYFWLLKTETLTLRVHSYAPTTSLPWAPQETCRPSAGSRRGLTGDGCVTLTSLGLHFQSVEWARCPGRSDVIVLPISCTQLLPAPHFFPRTQKFTGHEEVRSGQPLSFHPGGNPGQTLGKACPGSQSQSGRSLTGKAALNTRVEVFSQLCVLRCMAPL